ncbi:hypothetical protein VNO78_10492 [Psophocarpus tetragonolobus]|uniref:Uncharacterized protein n=1 Tax=Psophocarpus tetragonolobus TaxID=3891 RepID=A0AAN9XMK5_PSOTE
MRNTVEKVKSYFSAYGVKAPHSYGPHSQPLRNKENKEVVILNSDKTFWRFRFMAKLLIDACFVACAFSSDSFRSAQRNFFILCCYLSNNLQNRSELIPNSRTAKEEVFERMQQKKPDNVKPSSTNHLNEEEGSVKHGRKSCGWKKGLMKSYLSSWKSNFEELSKLIEK